MLRQRESLDWVVAMLMIITLGASCGWKGDIPSCNKSCTSPCITVQQQADTSCYGSQSAAPEVRVTNSNAVGVTVMVQQLSRPKATSGAFTPVGKPYSVRVAAGGTALAGCAWTKDVDYQYNLVDKSCTFAANELSVGPEVKLAIWRTPVLQRRGMLAQNKPQSCEQLCDADSTECLHVLYNQTAMKEATRGLASLYSELQKRQPITITRASLNALFGLSSDPCERSSTSIKGGKLSNVGKPCQLELIPRSHDGSSEPVRILIPHTISARFEQKGSVIEIQPLSGSGGITVKFPDVLFDDEWGGTVQKLSTNAERIVVTTQRSCVAFPFRTSPNGPTAARVGVSAVPSESGR
jgi:hypothetical protein